MKKCLINCWYGKFPNYFELWIRSCEFNKDYDFFVITDQEYTSKINNVKIINIPFEKLNDIINKKLNVNIKIEKPYKLCDFKPTYGIIFNDLIKEYDFWGHCDIDQIFGRINDFIKEEDLLQCEMINKLGHFCLYKNTKKINELFMAEGAKFSYKEVLNNNENYAFDEYSGMNLIIKKNNIKIKCIKQYADIYIRFKRYKMSGFDNYENQAFVWENGKLFRIYEHNGSLNRDELMYLHFQKKKPNIRVKNLLYNRLIIGSNYFDELENEISINDIINCNPYKGKIYEKFESAKYIYMKLLQFFKSSLKQKRIWIKQKR